MYTMEVEWDQVESLIKTELRETRRSLKRSRGNNVRVFSRDALEDAAIIQSHIDALSLIIKYYSVGT